MIGIYGGAQLSGCDSNRGSSIIAEQFRLLATLSLRSGVLTVITVIIRKPCTGTHFSGDIMYFVPLPKRNITSIQARFPFNATQ